MTEHKPKRGIGQAWAVFRRLLQRQWRWILGAIVLGVALVAIIYGLYWVPWFGFGGYTDSEGVWQREKTFWNWMELLVVPLVLAVGAGVFTWVTSRREHEAEVRRVKEQQEIEDQRAKEQREIEADRARESALQTYLDRMTELILSNGLRDPQKNQEARQVARARTLTTLRQLDGARKGLVLRFLSESELVSAPSQVNKPPSQSDVPVDLTGADLRGALLHGAFIPQSVLSGADLTGADLSGTTADFGDFTSALLVEARLVKTFLLGASLVRADLSRANLTEAILAGSNLFEAVLRDACLHRSVVAGSGPGEPTNLTEADLTGADLTEAVLVTANLTRANLSMARLNGANLQRAILQDATLSGADLTDANLSGAKVSPEQLALAKTLRGATMPNGTKHG